MSAFFPEAEDSSSSEAEQAEVELGTEGKPISESDDEDFGGLAPKPYGLYLDVLKSSASRQIPQRPKALAAGSVAEARAYLADSDEDFTRRDDALVDEFAESKVELSEYPCLVDTNILGKTIILHKIFQDRRLIGFVPLSQLAEMAGFSSKIKAVEKKIQAATSAASAAAPAASGASTKLPKKAIPRLKNYLKYPNLQILPQQWDMSDVSTAIEQVKVKRPEDSREIVDLLCENTKLPEDMFKISFGEYVEWLKWAKDQNKKLHCEKLTAGIRCAEKNLPVIRKELEAQQARGFPTCEDFLTRSKKNSEILDALVETGMLSPPSFRNFFLADIQERLDFGDVMMMRQAALLELPIVTLNKKMKAQRISPYLGAYKDVQIFVYGEKDEIEQEEEFDWEEEELESPPDFSTSEELMTLIAAMHEKMHPAVVSGPNLQPNSATGINDRCIVPTYQLDPITARQLFGNEGKPTALDDSFLEKFRDSQLPTSFPNFAGFGQTLFGSCRQHQRRASAAANVRMPPVVSSEPISSPSGISTLR
jgi:hypothetical protein